MLPIYNIISSVLQYYSMDGDYNYDEETLETESEDENMDTDDPEQAKLGAPFKSFNNYGKYYQRKKTDEIMANIRQTALDLGISFNQLILFLAKRGADIDGDKLLSKLFEELNRYALKIYDQFTTGCIWDICCAL